MKLEITQNKEIFEKIYKDMKTQFPPEELKSFDKLYSNLASENYNLAVIYDEGEIAGYVLYFADDFLWVDYLAIVKKHHSKGFGSKILTELFSEYKDLKGCYFEVEKVSEEVNTVKRMRFYERLGCQNSNMKYYFPNDVKELEMELLFMPFNELCPEKTEIMTDMKKVFDFLHKDVKTLKKTFEKIVLSNN